MNVSINQARNDPLPSCVDDLGVVRNAYFITRPDISDATTFHDDCCVPYRRPAGGCNDRCALNDDETLWCLLLCEDNRSEKQTQQNTANLQHTHVCLPRAVFECPFAP